MSSERRHKREHLPHPQWNHSRRTDSTPLTQPESTSRLRFMRQIRAKEHLAMAATVLGIVSCVLLPLACSQNAPDFVLHVSPAAKTRVAKGNDLEISVRLESPSGRKTNIYPLLLCRNGRTPIGDGDIRTDVTRLNMEPIPDTAKTEFTYAMTNIVETFVFQVRLYDAHTENVMVEAY